MFNTPKKDPLRVFIHVPKTAGSTVNAHLSAWGPGQEHIEHFRDHPRKLKRKLRQANWVSGHLALNKMQELLTPNTPRKLEMFGLIRDPVKQVASQYNWLMEIGHRGGRFFRNHPLGIQQFSEKLRASDNTNPEVIVANIMEKPGIFLNLQSRFVIGDDLNFLENPGHDRLKHYTHLGCDPDALIEQMTGGQPKQSRRENASPYHFDPSVFYSDQVQDFLRRNHRFDLRLYAMLNAHTP